VSLLGEALEAQEAASKRADALKQLKPRALMELLTPDKGAAATAAAGMRVRASPEKASPPEKRARKPTEKAAAVAVDEEGAVKKPAKKQKKQKRDESSEGDDVWSGVEFPRVTEVTECEQGADGFRVEVHAKRAGKGQRKSVRFALDAADLGSIDNLPGGTKDIFRSSFRNAARSRYGQDWPNALRLALGETVWGKSIIPKAAGQAGGNGPEDPNA
jgi:hypothetical protein